MDTEAEILRHDTRKVAFTVRNNLVEHDGGTTYCTRSSVRTVRCARFGGYCGRVESPGEADRDAVHPQSVANCLAEQCPKLINVIARILVENRCLNRNVPIALQTWYVPDPEAESVSWG